MAHIVIEGPIGVGKTSLSRLLAEELDAQLVLEVVEENPFLAPFYHDRENYAFKVQVFFLLSRYRQLLDLNQGALFVEHVVSDYLFDKDVIFASLNLSGAEWELYQELYRQLSPKLSPPDLVVYLRAEPDLLLQRIATRGRPFERDLDAGYLRRLSRAYNDHFQHYPGRVLSLDAAAYDYVANPADRVAIVNRVLGAAKAA